MSVSVNVVSGGSLNARDLKMECEEFCGQVQLSHIRTDAQREALTKDGVDRLRAAYPGYNVMVVYPRHSQHFQDCAHVELRHSLGTYHAYIFKRGTFTLHGDGGFINWCFSGNFDRNGKNVTFYDL